VGLRKLQGERLESSSHYLPPKKPADSTASLFLHAAVKNQHEKVKVLPPTKEHWAEYLRLRELAFRIRNAGFSPWPPVIFATGLTVVIALWLASRSRQTYFYSYPGNYLRTVQNLDPCEADGTCGYRRLMQSVEYGVPNPETDMTFCEKPRFEQGHVFLWMRLTDIGPCWSVDGFAVLKENGFAKLPPNCKPDYSLAPVAGHIACEGGKARF